MAAGAQALESSTTTSLSIIYYSKACVLLDDCGAPVIYCCRAASAAPAEREIHIQKTQVCCCCCCWCTCCSDAYMLCSDGPNIDRQNSFTQVCASKFQVLLFNIPPRSPFNSFLPLTKFLYVFTQMRLENSPLLRYTIIKTAVSFCRLN